MNSHISSVYRSIGLENFDLQHQPYIIRYPRQEKAPGGLIDSIEQYGLLCPIMVQEGRGGEIFIIHGARRALACQLMGWSDIPCQVIPSSLDHPAVYQLSLSIFLTHQEPNIMEQAGIICQLQTFLSEEAIIHEHLPRLGLAPNIKVLRRIRQLAGLEEEIARQVASGETNPQIAWRLLKLPPSARLPMYRFLSRLPFTLSQQFEIMEYVQEISLRDSSLRDLYPIEDLLAHPSIRDILASDDLDQRQRACAIRLFWRTRRYPRLTALEEEFIREKKRLHLPEHLELYPPQNFEHGNYKFELKFADLLELNQVLDFLSNLTKTKNLKNIIRS